MVLSAGIIPVFCSPEPKYLLLRAYKNWDFSKGRVEPEEEPLKAALRELKEETEISRVEFPWGTACMETETYGANKIARYYVGRVYSEKVSLPVSVELGIPEHHEFRWLAYGDAEKLLEPRVRRALDWAEFLVRRG